MISTNQFCNDEHARLAREQAAREAKEAKEGQAAEERGCHTIAREAEQANRRLNEGNYYLRCLRPGTEAHLLAKWKAERHEHEHEEVQRRHEHEQQEAQRQSHRSQLESEANSLKAKAKSLTEEQERLDHENKFSQGAEKSEEAFNAKYEAEKKLREARGE